MFATMATVVALAACSAQAPTGDGPAEKPVEVPGVTEADLEGICLQPEEVPGALEANADVSGPDTLEEAFERITLGAPQEALASYVAGHFVVYGNQAGTGAAPDEVASAACSAHLFEGPEGAASALTALIDGTRPRVELIGGIQEPVQGLGEEAFVQSGVTGDTASASYIWREGPLLLIIAVTGGTEAVTQETVRAFADAVAARLA
jgi:hypothetical protein